MPVNPCRNHEPVLLGELRSHRRHGAVAKLRRDVAPDAALPLNVGGGLCLEKIHGAFGIYGIVAARTVLRENRPDGAGELVGGIRRRLAGQHGENQQGDREKFPHDTNMVSNKCQEIPGNRGALCLRPLTVIALMSHV